jgi:hypothetical protein
MHFSFSTIFIVSRHILGPTVSIYRFLCFSQFRAIYQLIQCLCIIFHVFQFFFFIFQVLQFAFHTFPRFSFFLPYSSSYSVHFSFSTFFSIFCHILGPRACISHFPGFSVFLTIFQVTQCLCLIFHFFQFSHHIPDPAVYVLQPVIRHMTGGPLLEKLFLFRKKGRVHSLLVSE